MKKSWRILCGVAFMVLVLVLWPGPKEPEYHGKRLTGWLMVRSGPINQKERKAADEAIRTIGTNAIPYLLEWMQYQPGPWRMRMDAVRMQLTPRMRSSKSVSHSFEDQNEKRAEFAWAGFEILSNSGASAAGELVRIAKTSTSFEPPIRAIRALSSIGPEGIRGLMLIAEDRTVDFRRRQHAMNCLTTTAAEAYTKPITLCFVSNLADTNPLVSASAAYCLGRVGRFPDDSVPVLMKSYGSAHASVRVRAVQAMGEFGTNALIATNVLTKALHDPDTRIQDAAKVALSRVRGGSAATSLE